MLVSKKFTVHPGDPAVELLAGEDTAQSYELWVTVNGVLWIGGADVSQAASALLFGGPYHVRGESLWVIGPAVSSQVADVTVLAYSSGD